MSSCASFSSQLLPVRSVDDLAGTSNRIISEFDYDITMMFNGEKIGAITGYEEKIKNVFEKVGGFNNLSPGKGSTQYHLSFNTDGRLDEKSFGFWSILSAATLFIIPTTSSAKYDLEVVLYKDNIEIKRYKFQEKVRYWFHITMLFAFGNRPGDVDNEIIEQMLLNLVYEMKQDGYF